MHWMKQVLLGGALIGLCSAVTVEKKAPAVSVTLNNMNVFYIGVDNPITISVAGIEPENVHPSISGGSMSRTDRPGQYIVRVSAGNKAIINVTIPDGDSTRLISTTEYRVKRMPDPVAYVNDIRGEGVVLKENLQNLTGVFARMENFDFDGAFIVTGFNMSVIEDGVWKEYKTTGPELSAEMKSAMAKVNEEDKLLFHTIVAKGPDGTLRKLNTVTITVK